MATERKRRPRGFGRPTLLLLGSALPAWAVAVLLLANLQPWFSFEPARAATSRRKPGELARYMDATAAHLYVPLDLPQVERPPTRPAGDAGLAADAEVIGVVAGGRPRAYLVSALHGPDLHIVNDVVGGVAVSVTYCNMRDCARVFSGPGGEPLGLRLGGLYGGKMAVNIRGQAYIQELLPTLGSGGPDGFPFEGYPYERTTWGDWRKSHPTTDIFVGMPPSA